MIQVRGITRIPIPQVSHEALPQLTVWVLGLTHQPDSHEVAVLVRDELELLIVSEKSPQRPLDTDDVLAADLTLTGNVDEPWIEPIQDARTMLAMAETEQDRFTDSSEFTQRCALFVAQNVTSEHTSITRSTGCQRAFWEDPPLSPRRATGQNGAMRNIISLVPMLFFVLFMGCGGPTREAQIALTSAAEALRATDHELAPRYERAADEARERTLTWSEYDAAMNDWNTVESALRIAHNALLTAQFGLDSWRNGDQHGWMASVPCLVVAFDRLYQGLLVVGVQIESVTRALVLVRAFAGRCEAP